MAAKPHARNTSIDLPLIAREKSADLLTAALADTIDLRSQTKQAHWNVRGPSFIALHKLFDDLAAQLADQADDIAERITALGFAARGSVRMAAAVTRLPEYPNEPLTERQTIEAVAARFAALAKSTRAAIDAADELRDKGTADLFTGLSRSLDKSLWFIESHLGER